MHRRPHLRTPLALGVVLASLVASTPAASADTGPRHVPAPARVAVLGDSISRGFDACSVLQDCPEVSWSTGSVPAVQSHLARIAALNPAVQPVNAAFTGARASALLPQARAAVQQGADYVEVLIGANDACAPSEAAMTPVATFRTQVASAFAALRGTRVFVASVPDVRKVWQVAHTTPAAALVWSTFGLCQSMLANPTSTAPADADRRARVRQRIQDYNTVLRQECAALPTCRYDHGTVFKTDYALADLSPIDYYHPSVSGQARLSANTWPETWKFQPVG
ncbi:lysophospholipase L1-like esterase [Motilibacter peucedani]|uniref:Lysophospholipase L1-like esterase n=1 Tax=Motilibacter peucedani TaxID=598650 RepID=A0A420XTZ4_9ACTN|nr:GDSL-type esterase/lipase family protein [Motilibacter peucedani]RKS80211.1 lysophospholipase L1-like esterase [Motilibacter peucedani]